MPLQKHPLYSHAFMYFQLIDFHLNIPELAFIEGFEISIGRLGGLKTITKLSNKPKKDKN